MYVVFAKNLCRECELLLEEVAWGCGALQWECTIVETLKLIPVHILPPTTFVQTGLEAGSNRSRSVSAMNLNPVESGGL
ncbi:unnamed protein product [Sphagnum troendelagicum]